MSDIISGVYYIRNKSNGHIYIGSSAHIRRRVREHWGELRRGKHCNQHLQAAVNKYGIGNFSYRVLITCHRDMCAYYEQQFLDNWNPEYNINESATRVDITYDVRCKISAANLGKQGYWTGRKMSDAAKRNMRDARLKSSSRYPTDDTRRKLSAAQIGNTKFLGHKHTDESKQKISAAKLGKNAGHPFHGGQYVPQESNK